MLPECTQNFSGDSNVNFTQHLFQVLRFYYIYIYCINKIGHALIFCLQVQFSDLHMAHDTNKNNTETTDICLTFWWEKSNFPIETLGKSPSVKLSFYNSSTLTLHSDTIRRYLGFSVFFHCGTSKWHEINLHLWNQWTTDSTTWRPPQVTPDVQKLGISCYCSSPQSNL